MFGRKSNTFILLMALPSIENVSLCLVSSTSSATTDSKNKQTMTTIIQIFVLQFEMTDKRSQLRDIGNIFRAEIH